MPVDAVPCTDGNLVIVGERIYFRHDEDLQFAADQRYKSHFATCPKAKEHRKRK